MTEFVAAGRGGFDDDVVLQIMFMVRVVRGGNGTG